METVGANMSSAERDIVSTDFLGAWPHAGCVPEQDSMCERRVCMHINPWVTIQRALIRTYMRAQMRMCFCCLSPLP